MADSANDRIRPTSGDANAQLRAVVLCDLVDAAGLIERLGESGAGELVRSHDRLGRECLRRHGGHEIDKTEGFLLLFDRPIQAVAFAVDYQQALRRLSQQTGQPLRVRVGIHVGEVVLWRNVAHDIADGAKRVEVEGLAKAIAARLMGLARPGQILLSEAAFGLAQRARGELGSAGDRLRWLDHGRYRLKGADAPMAVFEVGEPGVSPMQAPRSVTKAKRVLPWWRGGWARAALVLLVVGISIAMLMQPKPAIAFAERDWVVLAGVRNLTNVPALEDAIGVALRISLEASKFVNVVSEIGARQGLGRMELPEDTVIDREVGSELTLRENARALLIPTVAEIGGRIRLTLEIVEPYSQSTVYTEMADSADEQGALAALEALSGKLRERLGEELGQIELNSETLMKVTSANIEVLRLYSKGMHAYNVWRFADARDLFREALRLDPDFALAYEGLALIEFSGGNNLAAYPLLREAISRADRLPVRESLYLDALSAGYDNASEMIRKWQLLADVFPDHSGAWHNAAMYTAAYSNNNLEALKLLQPALTQRNPALSAAEFLHGSILLGLNRTDEALEAFARADLLGWNGPRVLHAFALAAERRFDEADALMQKSSGINDTDLFSTPSGLANVVSLLDRGSVEQAQVAAVALSERAQRLDDIQRVPFEAIELSLRVDELAQGHDEQSLASLIVDAEEQLTTGDNRLDGAYLVAFATYLAARCGKVALAKAAIDRVHQRLSARGYDSAWKLLELARLEVVRQSGTPEDARRELELLLDGTEPFQARVVLLQALKDLHRTDEALAVAHWLTEHRGIAYGEYGAQQVPAALNLIESNKARAWIESQPRPAQRPPASSSLEKR